MPVQALSFREVEAAALGLRWRHPLYLAGRVCPGPRAAIVGSRAAHRRFAACVPALVAGAAEGGHALVSGGAVGIDAASHRAALAQHVPQVAVLPGPPDALYPADHRPLFEAIVRAGGAVICAQRPGTPMSLGMFASRNALVVQLAAVVVGVEARARSGTRGTLQLALRSQRVVGGLVGSPGVAWAIQQGAHSLGLPEDRETLAERMRLLCTAGEAGAGKAWPPELAPLVAVLRGASSVSLDDFANPIAAAAMLVEAETRGWISEVAPGRYVRARDIPPAPGGGPGA